MQGHGLVQNTEQMTMNAYPWTTRYRPRISNNHSPGSWAGFGCICITVWSGEFLEVEIEIFMRCMVNK